MERTHKHNLPYIMAAQAQKHVTHNEAIRSLDALIQIAVKSRALSTAPQDPQESDGYLVADPGAGDWLGKEGQLAVFQDGAWAYFQPKSGWLVWVEDESLLLVHSAAGLAPLSDFLPTGSDTLQNLQLVGVNATADSANPLTVQGAGTLFSHAGTDHRLTVNKADEADNASLVFQSGWSGRAEFGLAGNDDFSIKVSPDGNNFKTAMKVNRQDGTVDFPATNYSIGSSVNLFQDAGRLSSSSAGLTVAGFQFPLYFSKINGTASTGVGKFIHNNNDYGGTQGALNASVRLLTDKIKSPGSRRYGLEYWVCQFTAGSGVSSPYTLNGTTYYKSVFSNLGPSLSTLTFHVYLRALDHAIVIRKRTAEFRFEKDGVEAAGDVVVDPADGWVSVLLHWQVDTYTHLGYFPPFFDVNCLTTGDRWHMACPALIPGLTHVDPTQGVLASYNMWPAA